MTATPPADSLPLDPALDQFTPATRAGMRAVARRTGAPLPPSGEAGMDERVWQWVLGTARHIRDGINNFRI
jgi:hypothetical protein